MTALEGRLMLPAEYSASHALARTNRAGATTQVPGPLILSGMHRSRTSAVALCLLHVGVDLGPHLLAADRWNPVGYGEDAEVVALHRRMLGVVDATTTDGANWPDWGWPHAGTSRGPRLDAMRQYLACRAANAAPHAWCWGWKDPRATLFLRDWATAGSVGDIPAALSIPVRRSSVDG